AWRPQKIFIEIKNSEQVNEDIAAEVVLCSAATCRTATRQNGYTLAEATQRAATAVAKLHGLQDRKAAAEKPADPPAKRVQKAKAQQKLAKVTSAPSPLTGKASGEGDERLNSSHVKSSYAVFCLKKKN